MRIVGIVAVVALMVAFLVPGSAGAAPRGPDGFMYVSTELTAGDSYEFTCQESVGLETLKVFEAIHMEYPQGSHSKWLAGYVTSEGFVAVRAVGGGAELTVSPPQVMDRQSYPEHSTSGHVRSGPGTLRAGWAHWGGEVRCAVLVNGNVVEPEVGHLEDAVYLHGADWENGTGVHSSVGGGALSGEWDWSVDGFLFGFGYTQFGRIVAVDPSEGPATDPNGFPSFALAEFTSGEWNFGVEEAFGFGQLQPTLALMRLPA